MKILLDECVPWPMHEVLAEHECTTAQKQGWTALQSGQLLSLTEGAFELFITSDQNVRYQQNLSGRSIGFLVLSTNDLRRLLAASPLIQTTVAAMKRGEHRRLEIP
jgi:hypothetical protein